jgi:colicin import membrane protein
VIEMIRRHPRAFLFSVVLHGVVIGLTLLELSGRSDPIVVNKPSTVDQTIKAEVIDQKRLDERAKELAREQQLKKKREADAKKKAAELRKKKELEKKRKAEAERKAAEAKRKKAEAAKRKKAEEEKRKKAAADKKRKEEERKKAEAEKKRKAEEEAKRKAEEKKRLEEEARKKAEAEKREAERQARLKAEAEQRQKEAELKAQLAAEEKQRTLNRQKDKYRALITNKISRNWRQPANAGEKPECTVRIIQGPGGVILDVTFGKCPGTREYRLSVEAAVLKSDPLPKPEDPELFERNINLIFKPEN